jgi:peptide-methionine (S)-S-oxide reductase
MLFGRKSAQMVSADRAMAGRAEPIPTAEFHFVSGRPLGDAVPEAMQRAMFGMGCFWGAERIFWQLKGVWLTRVGYCGGHTPNPTYDEVCSGQTGHNEVVQLIFEPTIIGYDALLRVFWEGHNPTQGMRQGNDSGTQYRSGIYTYGKAQGLAAENSRQDYASRLAGSGFGAITTEIIAAPQFFHAEDYHQQYLAKNPGGYCGIGGTGVACSVGAEVG